METRGNRKIAGAVLAFHFDFRGKVVLDIGSSTGGFTEFALMSGAAKVVAIEKGARQMRAPLRFDERVDLHEKTDIFEVVSEAHKDKADLAKVVISTPEVIMADVSFISLRPILKYAKNWLAVPDTEFLVMLKPQFEAQDFQLNRGVVKNEKIRREIVHEFEDWLKHNGFMIKQKRDNVLAGKHGNVERFYCLNMV